MNKNIVIHYHWCPHFRDGIFRAISKLADRNVQFVFGDRANVEGLKIITKNFSYRTVVNKNIFISSVIIQFFNIFSKEYLFADRVVLGDIKFLNSHISIILSKLGFGRTFLWTHGLLEEERGLKWKLRKLYYQSADGVFTYSKFSRDILIKCGLNTNIIPIGNSNFRNSADVQFININTERNDRRSIAYIGRVNKDKKLEKVIESLVGAPKGVIFKIIGDGDALSYLKELVSKLQLSNQVLFLGPIYEEKELTDQVEDCCLGVIPTEVGLAGFTYLKLNLGLLYEEGLIHKPELHMLREIGYGYPVKKINKESINDAIEFYRNRDLTSAKLQLYKNYSSDAVAQNLINGLKES